MDLCPEVEGEGSMWRFIGLQSKNRREWYTIHLANMHIGATSVAFYDTLGPQAQKFVCKQTELTTICCAGDIVSKICKLKQEDQTDGEGKMSAVVNIVSFDDVPADAAQLAE